MAYRKKKRSFFQEQREANANPNFFNNMDMTLLRNNVRRIIRDVAEDNIIDSDYIYFTNKRVLDACIQESYESWQSCQVIRHALTAYRTIILPGNMVTPDIDTKLDYILCANELAKITSKENIWATANRLFIDISNGYDPKTVLSYLIRFPRQNIRSL